MRNIVLATLLLFGAWLTNAQNTSYRRVCIFEYGDSLTSCETNFKNLFNAWSKGLIANARETKLLSYHYVTDVTTPDQVKQYVSQFLSPNSMTSAFSISYGSKPVNGSKRSEELTFRLDTIKSFYNYLLVQYNKNEAKAKAEFDQSLKYMIDSISKSIQIGSKVFVVKVEVKGKKVDDLVICNPVTKKVVWDHLFKRVTLPVN